MEKNKNVIEQTRRKKHCKTNQKRVQPSERALYLPVNTISIFLIFSFERLSK